MYFSLISIYAPNFINLRQFISVYVSFVQYSYMIIIRVSNESLWVWYKLSLKLVKINVFRKTFPMLSNEDMIVK